MNENHPPNISQKGMENNECMSPWCHAGPARWYNHLDGLWYCGHCAYNISNCPSARHAWMTTQWPVLRHHQFEMRTDIERRNPAFLPVADSVPLDVNEPSGFVPKSRFIRRYGRHYKAGTQSVQ